MQQNFELLWRRARTLENEGSHEAAKEIYTALVEEDPDRLYVRLRLSAIEQGRGNYRASRAHAVRCAAAVRGKARWNDLAVVTRRLLTFDERRLVRDLILEADWNSIQIVKDSAVLSQHLWLIGEVDAALRLSEVGIERANSSCVLRYSRANALRYLGRAKDATDEFERCLELSPDDAYVHWSLAYHEKSDPPASRVARIRSAQGHYAPEAPEQAVLHYALFKELDDAGNPSEAWLHLKAGSALKRKSVRYDPVLENEGFAALQELVTRDFVKRQGRSPEHRHVPIFIVGMPRSGTTLLERILGSHSRVAPGGELNDFNSALSLESNRFFGHFVTPESIRALQPIDYGEVGDCYLERTTTWTGDKDFLIDKNPANFTNAGFIAKALPQARILCLRRNPMDACFSNLKIFFPNDAYGYSYELDELADYYVRFDQLSRHWRETLRDQYMEVDYENLVLNPVGMTERVMDFCGLEFEPDSVDITRNTAPVTTASSSQVRQPINSRSLGSWRSYERQLQPLRSRLEAALGTLD